jgi:hypothetical protein
LPSVGSTGASDVSASNADRLIVKPAIEQATLHEERSSRDAATCFVESFIAGLTITIRQVGLRAK